MLHSGGSDICGTIGAELTDVALNNLWDDVSAADADAGDTEFHCVYVKNIHPATSVANVKVRIDTDPAESNFEIGKGAAGRFTVDARLNHKGANAYDLNGSATLSIRKAKLGKVPVLLKVTNLL